MPLTLDEATSVADMNGFGTGSKNTVVISDDQNHTLSEEVCNSHNANFQVPYGDIYCNWTFDGVLCWPPVKAGYTVKKRCQTLLIKGVDPSKYFFRRCSADGRWEGKVMGQYDSPRGWTNYTSCFTPEMYELIRRLYMTGNESDVNAKLVIAKRTRTLEIIGFSISLAALFISLIIFCRFRGLRNNRTRIHKNLFVAMVIQVVIRLTLYIDQAVQRDKPLLNSSPFKFGIDNTPILCEASYVLLEYARTAMFMWMFIEGLYLHNVVTGLAFAVRVFQETSYYNLYTLAAWGIPILMTVVWTVVMTSNFQDKKCWWGYNLNHYFWILEGPRLFVIILNFLFLLNIIRVLVVKLRQSHTSEIEQVRKAVRAAFVLLPLLGITNIINMVAEPLDSSVWMFAVWSYSTHFLTSFQGLFIACLYCFLNGEVRAAIKKAMATYSTLRSNHLPPRRNSAYVSAVYAKQQSQTADDLGVKRSRNGGWIRMCCRGPRPVPPDHPIAETGV